MEKRRNALQVSKHSAISLWIQVQSTNGTLERNNSTYLQMPMILLMVSGTRAKSSASVRYVVALFLCMLVTLFASLVSSFPAFLFFLSTFRFHVLRIILVCFFDFMFVLFVSSFCVHCMRFSTFITRQVGENNAYSCTKS